MKSRWAVPTLRRPLHHPKTALTSFRARRGDLAVHLDGAHERAVRLFQLGRRDEGLAFPGKGTVDGADRHVGGVAALAPELLDRADAPQSALPRRADRLIVDDYVDRVGVHLREVAQGQPTAAADIHVELDVMGLI